MIRSFYGKDTFSSWLELDKLINDFTLKQYDIYSYNFANYNISDKDKSINNSEANTESNVNESANKNILNQLLNNLNSIDLFSKNKFIIIKYLDEKTLTKKDLDFLKISLQKIENDKNIEIAFLHDRKTKPNFLSKLKTKDTEFDDLTSKDLSTFIDKTSTTNNVKLTNQAKNLLISFFGDNIGALYNEIIKLSNYKPKIDENDILDLIKEPNIAKDFGLTNALAEKNKKLAIKLLWQEHDAGTPDLLIFGNIVNQIRNAIAIKEYRMSNKKHPTVHSFVQQKLLPFINSFELKQLKIMLTQLFQYDLKIKKGKMDTILALELFISDII